MFKRISETSDDIYSRMSVKCLGIKLFVQSLCENKINQSKLAKLLCAINCNFLTCMEQQLYCTPNCFRPEAKDLQLCLSQLPNFNQYDFNSHSIQLDKLYEQNTCLLRYERFPFYREIHLKINLTDVRDLIFKLLHYLTC